MEVPLLVFFVVYLIPIACASNHGCFKFERRFNVTDTSGVDRINTTIAITINTKELIQNKTIKDDCSDIVFRDISGNGVLEFWRVPGFCNTTETRFFINLPIILSGDSSLIYMFYGCINGTDDTDESIQWGGKIISPSTTKCSNFGLDSEDDFDGKFWYSSNLYYNKPNTNKLDHIHPKYDGYTSYFIGTGTNKLYESSLTISRCYEWHSHKVSFSFTSSYYTPPSSRTVYSCSNSKIFGVRKGGPLVVFNSKEHAESFNFTVDTSYHDLFLNGTTSNGTIFNIMGSGEDHHHTITDSFEANFCYYDGVKSRVNPSCGLQNKFLLTHNHQLNYTTPTKYASDLIPSYITLVFAYYTPFGNNETNIYQHIQPGMMIFTDSNPPLNTFTYVIETYNKFIRGHNTTSFITGGSDYHDHSSFDFNTDEKDPGLTDDCVSSFSCSTVRKCAQSDSIHSHPTKTADVGGVNFDDLIPLHSVLVQRMNEMNINLTVKEMKDCSNFGLRRINEGFDCICEDNYFSETINKEGDCNITKCFNKWNNESSSINNICSNHGNCKEYNKCFCENNYFGKECEIFKCFEIFSNETTKVCSNHGKCLEINDCNCTNLNYFGKECENHFCFSILNNDTKKVCSGHGTCIDINNCSCNGNYSLDENFEFCTNYFCNNIQFDDFENKNLCSGHGNCTSPNFCTCETNEYFNSNCEIWKCNNISNNDTLKICGNNGICEDINKCKCTTKGYIGINCDVLTCFNISSLLDESCGPNGNCKNNVDECDCNTGYYSLTTNIEDICMSWNCFGTYKIFPTVCSSRGDCEKPDFCNCKQDFEGLACETWSCNGLEYKNPGTCFGHGKCISPSNCDCKTGYSGSLCEKNMLYGTVMAPILSVFGVFVVFIFLIIVVCCCFCFICSVFIAFIFVSILLCFLIGTKIRLNKFSKLKNIDILIQEQLASEDVNIAHLNV